MDLAYDRIQEQSLPKEDDIAPQTGKKADTDDAPTLSTDVQDAYRAFSASPWGARIGGFFGAVAKQGESVYREAQHELSAVGQDASTGFTSLRDTIISRTRALSLNAAVAPIAADRAVRSSSTDTDAAAAGPARELTTDEAIKESETVLSRLKIAAAQRLKDIQKAEDAADEALLKFGTNIRDFLKDSIRIAGPGAGDAAGGRGDGSRDDTVLFESQDAQGKRVIHTSRFDAQLHVIHTNPQSFSRDPAGGDEYASWSAGFDIDHKTDDIAADLVKYPELRTTMEKLVPDQIPYPDFWKRYYFLRHSIETAEARRRDLLKAASAEEEVGWDEDSDDESSTVASTARPGTGNSKSATTKPERPGSTESSTTIQPPPRKEPAVDTTSATTIATASAAPAAKPSVPKVSVVDESRKSNEDVKSQADSDASYDVVGATSGVPSQAPNSPRDASRKNGDDSDEEDWE